MNQDNPVRSLKIQKFAKILPYIFSIYNLISRLFLANTFINTNSKVLVNIIVFATRYFEIGSCFHGLAMKSHHRHVLRGNNADQCNTSDR